MAAIDIPTDIGAGGKSLDLNRVTNSPCLRNILFGLVDDLAGVTTATIATANADATYGQPEADLINEIKAALNATSSYTKKVGKGSGNP